MKTSIWDILTGVVLLGMLCMIGGIGMTLVNPNNALNPFPPNAPLSPVVEPISLPTFTMTSPSLPPVWTLTPSPVDTKAPVDANGLRPSSTPVPTNTVVFLPSFTPSRTARSGISGGSCSVTFQNPKDNASQTAGKAFPVQWTIKNTSSKIWRSDSVDIRFVSGRYHEGADVRDMQYDVAPGGMLDLTINMNAPVTPGAYVANWSLAEGTTPVCSFFVAFTVY
jgi:Ig-like domain from next to BRCA1 gene